MKKYYKLFILPLFSFLLSPNLSAALTFQEVRTASDKILVAYFTSDTVDLNEVDITNPSLWTINGKVPANISKYVTEADACDHYIFLETDPLVESNRYVIETPYGKEEIIFRSSTVFCQSIKTNQVGYSALSKTRAAYFAIWTGTGGSKEIKGELPEYTVVESDSDQTITSGKLVPLGFDTSSGDYAYRINLMAVPEGGPYKIVVEGYGSSHPFGIGGEYVKYAAYTTFRAQYLQRCGVPIEKPAIRENACHTLIYDVDGPIGEANIKVNGDEPTFRCYGGYHDAGDADRRAYHIINPIINLMIFEAFPEYFTDGQYDIPGEFDENYNILGYTNNIPDIVDEAEWGSLAWEYLQNEDGSVHFGTETFKYPEPFAAPMDKDDKKYGTVKTDPRATCTSAGLFMHLARIIRPYKPEKAEILVDRAERAMAYGEEEMADPEKLYFYLQKYLTTGDEKAHEKVKELYTIVDSLKYHMYVTHGYSFNDMHFDNPAYFFSYIVEKEKPTDPEIVKFFTNTLQEAADSSIAMLRKRAYPVANNSAVGGWGHNVRQPQYAEMCMLYWSLTGEQRYIDAAAEMMDYKLGLNPLGISYVTQLGFHKVHNPHDRESAYTKKLGQGPKPGITVFGPGITGRWRKSPNLPDVEDLEEEKQFVDDIDAIYFTEFTIFETLTHDAFYTVLAGGGKWNGKNPYSTED